MAVSRLETFAGADVSVPAGDRRDRQQAQAGIAQGWRQRVLDHPADTLNRTQYGRTLIALARESGDLKVYEQAEAQLRRAVAAAPGDPGAAPAYAASLSAQHEFHAALEVLTTAAARNPDNPGIDLAIADTQLELNPRWDPTDAATARAALAELP